MATTAPIIFDSPLGSALLFRDLTWTEALGMLPEGRLTLLSTKPDIRANDLLGQPVSVAFELPKQRKRFFNGYVTRFERGGTAGNYFAYTATVHPWPWFLTRAADCRIFLDQKVTDVVKEVFAGYAMGNADFTLYGDYPVLTQCVQYRESDFQFVSRLLERHGMYYCIDCTDKTKQTMRIFDANAQHEADPHLSELVFLPEGGRQAPLEGYLSEWHSVRSVQSGQFALNDLNYERPNTALLQVAGRAGPYSNSGFEVYDAPYGYDQNAAGKLYVDVCAQESGSQFDVYHGTTNAYDLRIGRTVQVKSHADSQQNAKYLITGASYVLRYTGDDASLGDEGGAHYECRFAAIPFAQQYRPAARTPRPFVHGPQLATVTGPAGEEIYTDKFGRVKLLFHWDRYGTRGKGKGQDGAPIKPELTSCWVPVAQIWAGNNFGAIFTPRIKQEVVVEFLEGDPDRPIVTGRVYNQENPPPWALPDNKTQSGVLTRSSLNGAYANANMLRFEDKKGAEQLSLHAEKNQDISVENDETHDVGHDRKKTIGNDETTSVQHDRSETVGNNEKVSIGVNRDHSVGNNENWSIGAQRTHSVGADESIQVGKSQTVQIGTDQTNTIGGDRTLAVSGQQSVSIGKDEAVAVSGKRATQIGKDDHLQVGKTLTIEAVDEITLKTGQATLVMKQDGTIQINGVQITVVGSGQIGIKASGNLVLKGASIASN